MPWTGIAAAVAGSALSSAGGILSANSANAKSKRAALMQFAMQNYLMDKQNEYNKPINQMRRLEEAGLNPNLVYGSGADALSAGPSGGAMPNVTPSKMQLDFFDKMSMIQHMKQQQAQIDRTEADTKAVNNNIDISRANLELQKSVTNARIRQINAETEWLKDRVDYKNPNTWNRLKPNIWDGLKSNSFLKLINPFNQAEKLGSVYHNLYDNVYGLLEAKYGKRKRR